MMHVTATPDPLRRVCPELSPELAEAVMAMLVKEPVYRPTIAELGRRLAAAMGREAPPALLEAEVDSVSETTELEAEEIFSFGDLLTKPSPALPSPASRAGTERARPMAFPSDDIFGLGIPPDEE